MLRATTLTGEASRTLDDPWKTTEEEEEDSLAVLEARDVHHQIEGEGEEGEVEEIGIQ